MKYSIIWISVAVLSITACDNKSPKDSHDKEQHEGEHIFACPMHPEVTGKEGDKCPKCGMDLEHTHNTGMENKNTYVMAFSSNPPGIEAGKKAILSLTPKIVGEDNQQVPLDVEHEKK